MPTRRIEALLAEAARARPEATAYAVAGKKGVDAISYGALADRARRLATWLAQSAGVGEGDRVGLCLSKSPRMLTAVYGVLAAGAAYVPLDPAAPAKRNQAIAEGCDLRLIIDGQFDWSPADATAPEVPLVGEARDDQAPAYLLHTSGSTGRPKGVVLSHRNALAFVESMGAAFGFRADDVFAHHAPLHFDLSVFDLFVAASVGAAVEGVPPMLGMFPRKLAAFIDERRITVWNSVASLVTMLVQRGGIGVEATCPRLRLLFFSGDVLAPATLGALGRALPHARSVNIYGQTEANSSLAAGFDAAEAASWDAAEPLPLGRPLPGFEVRLVDETGACVTTPGVRGELVVGGETVGAGYWGMPDAPRFGADPAGRSERRFYWTGDHATRDVHGDFYFAGRADDQIKTRGHRVALGEVERALAAQPEVAEGVVWAVPDTTMGRRIVGAFVPRDGKEEPRAVTRRVLGGLRQQLPAYMLPEPLQALPSLPRTATGKVDRTALQEGFAARLSPSR
ncbi:MAG: amino acid adenylation domain-containing protein [Myxococcota bacterium]